MSLIASPGHLSIIDLTEVLKIPFPRILGVRVSKDFVSHQT